MVLLVADLVEQNDELVIGDGDIPLAVGEER